MQEIHCEDCGRFLCKASTGELEIKCPNGKCKHLNKIVLKSYKQLLTTPPQKDTIRA